MKRSILIFAAVALIATTAFAQSDTSVTVGAAGIYPPGTTFNAIPINAIQSGYGVIIGASTIGDFSTVLVGVNALGAEQDIVITGKATAGSRTASNIASFSGSCSVDMGDGTPAALGVPFTATITTNANSQGSIALVIGLSTLPAATVNQGTMTIQ
jgi:hypothetical protein